MPGDYGFYNHIPAKEARALLNDDKIWRSYFKFTFERNPWDRQVSAYHFRYRRHRQSAALLRATCIASGAPGSTITKSIRSTASRAPISSAGSRVSTADFRRALKEIGLAFDQELPRAKANYRRSQKHYRDYYDDETRAIVDDWYAPEIRLLAYEF